MHSSCSLTLQTHLQVLMFTVVHVWCPFILLVLAYNVMILKVRISGTGLVLICILFVWFCLLSYMHTVNGWNVLPIVLFSLCMSCEQTTTCFKYNTRLSHEYSNSVETKHEKIDGQRRKLLTSTAQYNLISYPELSTSVVRNSREEFIKRPTRHIPILGFSVSQTSHLPSHGCTAGGRTP